MTTYGHGRQRRRRHPVRVIIIVLIVLIALLVAADFAARAWAENKTAAEIQQHGFPKKPNVDIEGFPFLTQVAAHKLNDIQISASNVTEPHVQIASIDASLKNVHINGTFSGGTISSLHGTAAITFPALTNAVASEAGSLGQLTKAALTFSAASPSEVKATVKVLMFKGTVVWRVTTASGNVINVQLVSDGGLPPYLLKPISDITLNLPKLPLGLKIQSISVNSSGLVGVLTGQNVSFGS
jgi:LmeA-like phospholipid-binding